MSVQAIGTNAINGNTVITPARPVYATTYGTYDPVAGGTIPVLFALNASDPFGRLGSVSFNGTVVAGWKTNNSKTIPYAATAGTNQVLVTITDNNTNTVFNDWLQFVAAAPFPVNNIGTNIPDGSTHQLYFFKFSHLRRRSRRPVAERASADDKRRLAEWRCWPGPCTGDPNAIWVTNYIGNATNFLVSVNGAGVTGNTGPIIGLSYGPAEVRQFAPGNTANLQPVNPAVTITGVTALPGGGIQFSFNVPAGTNYAVEASGNLINWQTNFSGTGQSGGESYTNTAGTSTVQFYRIKL